MSCADVSYTDILLHAYHIRGCMGDGHRGSNAETKNTATLTSSRDSGRWSSVQCTPSEGDARIEAPIATQHTSEPSTADRARPTNLSRLSLGTGCLNKEPPRTILMTKRWQVQQKNGYIIALTSRYLTVTKVWYRSCRIHD